MIINTILPIIFDYLDVPFELITSCRTIQNNAVKYPLTLKISLGFDCPNKRRRDRRYSGIAWEWTNNGNIIQINPQIFKKYKFKKFNIKIPDVMLGYITMYNL